MLPPEGKGLSVVHPLSRGPRIFAVPTPRLRHDLEYQRPKSSKKKSILNSQQTLIKQREKLKRLIFSFYLCVWVFISTERVN